MSFAKVMCWLWCRLIALILFCGFFVLPSVGLVFWFVLKTPEQFMLTCIGICVTAVGFGVMTFLSLYGYGKYKQLSA